MRSPKDFFRPLAVGAPDPVREIPFPPSRMIHFFPASNPKMVAKVPDLAPKVDILLANLEDGVPASDKEAARAGLVEVGKAWDASVGAQLWTRVNSLDSPWALDDIMAAVTEVGDRLDVIMIPKVEGPEDIHYVDRLVAQLEARAGLTRPLLLHAILETARGVANVEEICAASPRMQGLSLGPADLAASRRMKTTRVGGGHPGYLVRQDPPQGDTEADRPTRDIEADRPIYQQDLWHYTIARMVDACASNGILPFYGPFGDIKDTVACEDQFRNAFLLGCVGAWSLHPVQIDIARKVFSPSPTDVRHARRVIAAMGDGTGAVMLDGKMEDDASVKQCKVMVELAEALAAKDPELAKSYAEDADDAAAGERA
jgi:malyl-CoA/(S)-citramalyl-CoA lyase